MTTPSRSRSLRALAALSLAGLLALTSCSANSEAPADAADETAQAEQTEQVDETRTVETEQGDVEVPADPQRVVVLNYALAGYLYDLDVPVVGLTQEDFDYGAEFSDFWAEEAEQQGTEFVPWGADGFDLEAILALEPDLIVGGGIGFPLGLAVKGYDDLSAIAPTVIVSGSFSDWKGQYSFLADEVLGKGDVYDEAVAAYEARVTEVADAITPPPGPAAFLSVLPDGRPFVGIETMGLPQIFAELGIEPAPLFAEGDFEPYTAGGDAFELSTEQLGQVVTQPTVFVTGFNTDIGTIDDVRENPVYGALPAFQNDSAYMLPYWVWRGDYDETMALLDIVEELFG